MSQHRRRTDTLQNYKSRYPCADCGRRYPPIVMDFDHVRGDKIKDVSQMADYSWDSVYEEIQKCEVVCANCHRIRTEKRQDSPPVTPGYMYYI